LSKRDYVKVTLNSPRFVTLITLTVVLLGLFLPHYCFAANYEYTYWLLDHPDRSTRYQLTVSVTSSLYEYYRSKDHSVQSYQFAKFITPYTLKPIADNLWTIYNDDEDFANGVLMIVHQIPYQASTPQKYPVETIVENEGDCDLFSFLAASIMMAGGLDVVLLYYEGQGHMNVGVNLSHAPQDARSTVFYFSYDSERYYVAETTGSDWENGWRVGEYPDQLRGASAQIITLEDAEQSSPGQVSSSYTALTTSSITLTLSSTLVIPGDTVTISGSISPAHSDEVVTIYIRSNDSPWVILKTVSADSNGKYSYTWTPNAPDTQYLRASWSGDTDHAGADSNIQTLRVSPINWIVIAITSIALVSIAIVILVALKRSSSTPQESPQVPSQNESFTQTLA